ncbi:opticin isoform X2 [Halichoeres trimaculatus]|uniref:opticin isoform X2 n=1 Tax=Halichoeres trimaculatus TaxID=147232 RepID=UPI003D9DE48D
MKLCPRPVRQTEHRNTERPATLSRPQEPRAPSEPQDPAEQDQSGESGSGTLCGSESVVSMSNSRRSSQSLRGVLVLILDLVLVLLGALPTSSAPPGEPDADVFDLENYDLTNEMDWENLDANIYGDSYDYEDLDQEVEVGSIAPDSAPSLPQSTPEQQEELTPPTQPHLPTHPPSPATLDFKGPGLFGPETGLGMPTCLLCVCISGSVYCDDTGLDQIPPLPKDTTRFYGRFNRVRHVKNTDFMNLKRLQSIDLTGNQISGMDEDVFASLSHLQDLVLPDNHLQMLPELPRSLRLIDVRNNRLGSRGLHAEGFKDMSHLEFLYLSNNHLDYIPSPLPLSLRVLHLQNNNVQSLHEDTFCNRLDRNFIRRNLEDIRLDGNPLDINLFASSYTCLPRLPVGRH